MKNGDLAEEVIAWMKEVYTARAHHTSTLHNRRLLHDIGLLEPLPEPNTTPQAFHCEGCDRTFKKVGYYRMHLRQNRKCPSGMWNPTPTL